jgi:hypothetical protein
LRGFVEIKKPWGHDGHPRLSVRTAMTRVMGDPYLKKNRNNKSGKSVP